MGGGLTQELVAETSVMARIVADVELLVLRHDGRGLAGRGAGRGCGLWSPGLEPSWSW